MRRLISCAMHRPYASFIRAFNSLDTLLLTTAADYEDRAEHDFVSVSYSPSTLLFSVAYGGSRSKQFATYQCHESQADSLVEALVLRLALSVAAPAVREVEVYEDRPAFGLGDEVEVILNDRNRTERRGKIAKVVHHTKKQRYFFLLEVGGKTVPRRYYSDDLRRA